MSEQLHRYDLERQIREKDARIKALEKRIAAAVKAYETIRSEPWWGGVQSGAYTVARHLLPAEGAQQ